MADLLPKSLSGNASFDALMQIAEERLAAIPIDQCIVNLIENVDSSALVYLANQFGIAGLKGWNSYSTDEERRLAIKNAYNILSKEGTPYSIRLAFRLLGFEISFYEGVDELEAVFPDLVGNVDWWNYVIQIDSHTTAGEPPDFDFGLSEDDLINILTYNDVWKNARSVLVFFLINLTPDADSGLTTNDFAPDTELDYVWEDGDDPDNEANPNPGEDGLAGIIYDMGSPVGNF